MPDDFEKRLVSAIEPLPGGRFLLATGGIKESGAGIFIGGVGDWITCNQSNGRIGGDRVHDLEVNYDAQYFWAATDGGLACLDFEGETVLKEPYTATLQSWIERGGIGALDILDIYRDPDDALWLSTWRHGIVRLEDGSVESFGAAHGLPDTQIHALTPRQI